MNNKCNRIAFALSTAAIVFSSLSVSASAGTGPYRRVTSKAGTTLTPYTYEEVQVDLPVASNIFEKPGTNDTAYVYLGGNGSGTEIDAGLQHSPTKGNWAPIILCKGKYSHPSDNERFRGGQTITMQFYVTSNNNVTLKVTGITDSGVKKTIVTSSSNASGWKSNGVGNIFKRVTSIGQKPENLSSGSYFKNVRWHDSYIGTISNHHKWLADDTNGYISYPNKTKVSVNFVSPDKETVNINTK